MGVGSLDFQTADGVDEQHVLTLVKQGLGLRWFIVSLDVAYKGTPPDADLTITGLDAPMSIPILSKPGDMIFFQRFSGYVGKENTDVVVTVPAAGAMVRGIVHLTAFKIFNRQIESSGI